MASDSDESSEDFIARRKRERELRQVNTADQARMVRLLSKELNEARSGPTREDIEHWLAEVLIESDEWDAMARAGDVYEPKAEVLFTVETAARIIAKHLHPIGAFNGGGSICVFRDPEAWEWDDLTLSRHRKALDAAEARERVKREGDPIDDEISEALRG